MNKFVFFFFIFFWLVETHPLFIAVFLLSPWFFPSMKCLWPSWQPHSVSLSLKQGLVEQKKVLENKETRPHDVDNDEHLNTLPGCEITWPTLPLVVQQVSV